MRLSDLRNQWKEAAESGSLLTPKHDPNNRTFTEIRSVLTQEMSGSLKEFIGSPDYSVKHYKDNNHLSGPGYFEVIPNPNSEFDVLGSGIYPMSPQLNTPQDRLIVVSGSNQGWHVFTEQSTEIEKKVNSGRLILIDTLQPEN